MSLERRFWSKVKQSNGCWIWTGALNDDGYGHMRGRHGSVVGAHRVSWEMHNGIIPAGLSVCHHCDNPMCVRPDHLYLGTMKQNIADCVKRGRLNPGGIHGPGKPKRRVGYRRKGGAGGELNGHAKLTVQDVRSIRSRHAEGETQAMLARSFKIDAAAISRIVQRKAWKGVV